MEKIKKIKLVTFAPHPNFGTCLQSYALNYVLRKMGHDVEFIYNRREVPPLTPKRFAIKTAKRILKTLLSEKQIEQLKARKTAIETSKGQLAPVVLNLPNHRLLGILSRLRCYRWVAKHWYYGNRQKRKVYKFTFIDDNFHMRRLFTASDYKAVVEDADLFVTGSDQIWNPYCGGYNPMMFLEFVQDGTKCIAYSSSISQPDIHPKIKDRMAKALSKFQYIGVREQRSVELLNTMLGRTDVQLVVDPTYLLSAKEWENFGEHAELEFEVPERYIFCYFVGEKRKDVYEQMVQDVKRFTGISEVITLECYDRPLNYGGGRLYKDGGPYEWVYLLRHASYVCMDSFHATVFALKFQKEFVHALKNADTETGSQNTRMYDILSRYGLFYKIYHQHNDAGWQQRINYNKVNPIIEHEIKESLEYLRQEIES